MVAESQKRTIAKTISWRIVATTITTLIVFVLTGELALGLTAGFFECVIKIAAYYFHERAWQRVDKGYLVQAN